MSKLPSAVPGNLKHISVFPLQKERSWDDSRKAFLPGNWVSGRQEWLLLSTIRVVYSVGLKVEIFRSKSCCSTFTNCVTKCKLALSSLVYEIEIILFHQVTVRLN